MAKARVSPWDLTALLNAADPKASLPERNLWLIRLFEWLRHVPVVVDAQGDAPATPTPVLRLKHLLGVLDRHPEHQARVAELVRGIWTEVDSAALLADFGFAPRMDLWRELGDRVNARVLPQNPATTDLGELFPMLFPSANDAAWLLAIDAPTLARLGTYLAAPESGHAAWRAPFVEAIVFLSSAVRASGFSPTLRRRMSAELLTDQPFRQLARVAEQVGEHALGSGEAGAPARDSDAEAALLQEAQYLRALLDACRRCADSVHDHLAEYGVSVNVVFEVDQLRQRTHRIESLLTCVISPAPADEIIRLLAELVRTADERRSIGALMSRHYSLLARQVAERSAETGEHYITRDRAEYREMLRSAAGGGAVLAGTTFIKFGVLALGLTAFWGGFWAGVNYAVSFLVVQWLHFTVATKQPAMTAPAMAEKLGGLVDDERVEGFVDEVAHLIRSQAAGIFGNLAVVAPIVLGVQWLARAAFGAPLVGHHHAEHVLESLTLLGPTALFAAFTGVLLFASSLIAGWAENWFVWHRLDSAIAWNPRIVARLGAARATRWAAWWRANISGFAANVSLGMMLGIVPVVALFFSVPLEVRHVTLSTGQLAAALGAEGLGLLRESAFWWCVAGIAVTGALNLGVSFLLAFKVALRSRGIHLADRSRIYRAIRSRMRRKPLSFVLPPA
jgi:site-specific recombinase